MIIMYILVAISILLIGIVAGMAAKEKLGFYVLYRKHKNELKAKKGMLKKTNEEEIRQYFEEIYKPDYFTIFTRLSCIPEEDKVCECKIVFVDKDDFNSENYAGIIMTDSIPFESKHVHKIRKKWSATYNEKNGEQKNHRLIVESDNSNKSNNKLIGFVMMPKEDEKHTAKIIGISKWIYLYEKVYNGKTIRTIIMYNNGVYYSNIDRYITEARLDEFEKKMSILFGSESAIDECKKIFSSAIKGKNSTMLIFSDDKNIDEKLQGGFKIKHHKPNENIDEITKGITSIDGAAVFNVTGECIIIGATVPNAGDDAETSKGTKHGAAHNFIAKYDTDAVNKYLIIVISQDGPITILPREVAAKKED